MIYIIIFLFGFFLICLPLYWIYKLIINLKQKKTTQQFEENDQINIKSTNHHVFMFMDDYRMWKNLTEEDKKIRLMDLDVILKEGKDELKNEMIRQGFQVGSKIIDVKYFTGLTEHGFTITGFLIQHENGGEIRELTINIDLAQMKFHTTRNSYFNSGRERYYYLKKRKGLVEI